MLHAIKPMIWQALQTLREPNEDTVKRSKLQVMSHNLSTDGVLAELLKIFDTCAPKEMDTVDCRLYLETIIHEAVQTLQSKNNKNQKLFVERVHQVCWELCRAQVKGHQQSMLTEECTKIWWKIFTTFAERDSQNERTLYPVVMDWEEVDYWANVVLKVMALPTNTPSRKEREVMGNMNLNFHEALVRFNAKLNENNSMYVLDGEGKPDLKYIENAMNELNIRLFEGIHLNGFLLPVKKGHTQHPKWCVLYQLGMAFADNPADVDSSNSRAFVPIGQCTEVTPVYDKNERPVRFQLKNGKDSREPMVFEANNISIRNKWVTAIICLKQGKLPDYEKDFINRRKLRIRNRQFEVEAKETMRQQKERTKKQVADMSSAMEKERELHESQAEQMRNASAERAKEIIDEHENRMTALMLQMTELGIQYETERSLLVDQHKREMQQLVQQHGDQLGSVQTELESETARLKAMLEAERETHKDDVERRDARIDELEKEVARLNSLLDSLTKEKEESSVKNIAELQKTASELAEQRQESTRLSEEASRLAGEVAELRGQLNDSTERSQEDKLAISKLTEQNEELKIKAEKFEEAKRELQSLTRAKESMENKYEAKLQKYRQDDGASSHRGPGFDTTVKLRSKTGT